VAAGGRIRWVSVKCVDVGGLSRVAEFRTCNNQFSVRMYIQTRWTETNHCNSPDTYMHVVELPMPVSSRIYALVWK
jgi:hypothetical protein